MVMARLLTILLLIAGAWLQAGAQAYMTWVDSADAAIARADWMRAETMILGALRTDPANYNNSLLLSNLATIQRKQGRLSESINNYTLALAITPNAVTLLRNRGEALLEADSLERAAADFTRVAELDERDFYSRYYLFQIALEQGDLNAARQLCEQLGRIDGRSADTKFARALLAKAEGRTDDAIAAFTSLIEKEPTAELLSHRAECHLAAEHYGSALTDINEAISLSRESAYLYLIKAKIKAATFEIDEARYCIDLAVRYGADRAAAERMVGVQSSEGTSGKR